MSSQPYSEKNRELPDSPHQFESQIEREPSSWAKLLRFNSKRRVQTILQVEAGECGLACIAMLANYHGLRIDMLALRSVYATSLRGSKLSELSELCTNLGLGSRAVRVEFDDLKDLTLPCIIHWNLNHFVVLERIGRRGASIVDPAIGRRNVSPEELSASFTGVALEVAGGPKVSREDNRVPISLTKLAGSVSGLLRGVSQILVIALVLELIAILSPQFLRLVVDQVIADFDTSLLTLIGFSFCLLLLIKICLDAMRSWMIMWLGANISVGWYANVFSHLVKLPNDYFAKRYVGDVLTRFNSILSIQQTLTTKFVVVLTDGVMAVITAGMLLIYSPSLALAVIAFSVTYALIRVLYFRVFREASLMQINAHAQQQSALIDSLRSMQTLRLNNASAQRSARFMNVTVDVANAGVRMQRLTMVFDGLNGFVIGCQRIVVLWFGAKLAVSGDMTPGTLMAFVAYSDQFSTRFVSMADFWIQLKLLRLHGERLADIVLTPPERNLEGNYSADLQHYGLEIENINFRYPGSSEPILVECSLEISEGKITAITGVSGGGKSTLAKLILGALDQQSGRITIGGVDVRMLGRRRVRSIIASVLQDDQLTSGSILENITFFDPGGTLQAAKEAAKLAGIATEIEKMPMGYQSPIGDMGSTLSGGQHQRLLLARAFYRKPKILILDEATSNLDSMNEALVSKAVRDAGLTTLIIAHRRSTIDSADDIYVLHGGRLKIVEAAPGNG